MMSKTHITVGVGTVLAVLQPHTAQGCCMAIIGGAVGGIIPDIDILDNDSTGDARFGQGLALGLTLLCLAIDAICGFGICNQIFSRSDVQLGIGLILFVILYRFGCAQPHRGFTHSLLALVLYSIPVIFIDASLTPYFMLGFASHLAIDLLNKREIQILFPIRKGICFKLCYANKTGNKILMYAGLVVSVVFLTSGLFL